jgi:hypothetical protein
MQPTEQKRICFDSYAICCFDRKDTKSNPLTRKTAHKRLNINYFKERLVHFYGTVVTLTNFQTVVTGDTTAAGTNGYGYVPKNGSYSSTPHIPSPIDYFSAYSSAGATSDLDGKVNTEKILAVDNAASTAWQTAASITNDYSTATVHPAAQCCWRFNPGSTNQGDWYLPSIGELAFIMPNFNDLQAAISDVSGVQLDGGNLYWSSTEYLGNRAWRVNSSNGDVRNYVKNDGTYVRAFLAL